MAYQLIYNNKFMTGFNPASPPMTEVGTIAGQSIKIMNMTQYGLSLYAAGQLVDYVPAYQYVILENRSDYYVQLDNAATVPYVYPNTNVAVKTIDEKLPYRIGILIQTQQPGDVQNIAGNVQMTGTTNVNIQNTPNVAITGTPSMTIANASVPISGSVDINSGAVNATIQNASINSQVINTSQSPVQSQTIAFFGDGSDGAYAPTSSTTASIPLTTTAGVTASFNLQSGTLAADANGAYSTSGALWLLSKTNYFSSLNSSGVVLFQATFSGFVANPTQSAMLNIGSVDTNTRYSIVLGGTSSSRTSSVSASSNYLGFSGLSVVAGASYTGAVVDSYTLQVFYDSLDGSIVVMWYSGTSVSGAPIMTQAFSDQSIPYDVPAGYLLPPNTIKANGYTGLYSGAANMRISNFIVKNPLASINNLVNGTDLKQYASINIPADVYVRYANPCNYALMFANGAATISGVVRVPGGTPNTGSTGSITMFGNQITVKKGGSGGAGGAGGGVSGITGANLIAPGSGAAGGAATIYGSGVGGGGGGGGAVSSNLNTSSGGGGSGGGIGGAVGGYGGSVSPSGNAGSATAGGSGYINNSSNGFVNQSSGGGPGLQGRIGGYQPSSGSGIWVLCSLYASSIVGVIMGSGANGAPGGYGGGTPGTAYGGGGGGGAGGDGGASVTLISGKTVTVTGSVNVNGGSGGYNGLGYSGSTASGVNGVTGGAGTAGNVQIVQFSNNIAG